MKLNQIRDNKGARKRAMTVGRGIGSGKGKTSGRGGKGQTARTGVAIKGFEGGQMPLIRRMPKRGFNNYEHANRYSEVNLSDIQKAIDSKRLSASKSVDVAALIEAGVLKYARDGLSLLGKGTLKTKVTIVATRASQAAIKAVEAAGGKVDVLPAKENKLLKLKEERAAKRGK
jgi:large subunit ribosomal protein L15